MVASPRTVEKVVPGNLSGQDLVDPSARLNESLNRSVETCSVDPMQPRQLRTGLHNHICLPNHDISVHGLSLSFRMYPTVKIINLVG